LTRPGGEAGGGDRVAAAEAVDDELVGRLLVLDRHQRPAACDRDPAGVSGDVEPVVAVGAVDGHAVRAAVAGAEIEVHGAHVGSVEVADEDGVYSAAGGEVDVLHVVRIHRDPAGVAQKREPTSVCGERDALVDVGAVEEHRVGAVAALDGVAAVAWIPDEGVVAGAHEGDVGATVAVDRVVPGAAGEHLAALAAGDRVVPVASVDRRRDRVGERAVAVVDAHDVVAGACFDGNARDAVAVEAEVGRAVGTGVDLDDRAVAGAQAERDRIACVRALDRQHAVPQLRPLDVGAPVCMPSLLGLAGRRIPGTGNAERRDDCSGDDRRRSSVLFHGLSFRGR